MGRPSTPGGIWWAFGGPADRSPLKAVLLTYSPGNFGEGEYITFHSQNMQENSSMRIPVGSFIASKSIPASRITCQFITPMWSADALHPLSSLWTNPNTFPSFIESRPTFLYRTFIYDLMHRHGETPLALFLMTTITRSVHNLIFHPATTSAQDCRSHHRRQGKWSTPLIVFRWRTPTSC